MRKFFGNLFNSSTVVRAQAPTPKLSFISGGKLISEALIGTEIEIEVSNLAPGESVVLRSERGEGWRAHAKYLANDAGIVNTSRERPVEGTYTGVDASGLFWSQKPEKRDVPDAKHGDPFSCRAEVRGNLIESELKFVTALPGVRSQYLKYNELGLAGKFSLPPGSGPFPVVLSVSGSDGGFSEVRTEYLASHGFACLSLAYFAAEGLPAWIREIPIEYFAKAISWLKAQNEVNGEAIAVMGGSRGGELALLLGSLLPEIRAVVATAPSAVTWDAGGNQASWTFGEKPIPYLSTQGAKPAWEVARDGVLALDYTVMFEKCLENSAAIERAIISVEKINGPILFLAGENDRMWPASRMAAISVERLKKFGHPHENELLSFSGAGHALGVPGLPTTRISSMHPLMKKYMNLGGSPQVNAEAQRKAAVATLKFLKKHLG